ncbi:hypothetical protein Pfo_013960 [Paulownia fortunei]|nr:hypothetical protein Pfo_013960 [Paulownia fortunei]
MAKIEKQKFQILNVTNRLNLAKTLNYVDIEKTNGRDKANAMIFIQRLYEIWHKLKDIFDHTRTMILPWAQYDWQYLRLQDFKSVAKYNSALFKIESRLSLCKTNELLLKNHGLRPYGSQAMPEAHASSNRSVGRFRGRKHGFRHDVHRGGGRDDYIYPVRQRQLLQKNYDKGKMPIERPDNNICNRFGMTGHWTKV